MSQSLTVRSSLAVASQLLAHGRVPVAYLGAGLKDVPLDEGGYGAMVMSLDRKGPAYAPLLANRSYTGLAALFGKRLITQYRPITDASGRVIGALFVAAVTAFMAKSMFSVSSTPQAQATAPVPTPLSATC